MTGSTVRETRDRMGLRCQELADLLGVGMNTVGRWEAAGDAELNLDPRNEEFLSLLVRLNATRQSAQARQLGQRLRVALVRRGGLYALYRLLALAYVAEVDELAHLMESRT